MRRRVTRAYVVGLIAATLILAAALVVVSWGLLALALGREPVESNGIPLWFGTVTIGAGLALLGMLLWRQAISLLRGNSAPVWGVVLGAVVGSYLLWCAFGMLAGLSTDETWLSPFAGVLPPVWGIASLVFWGVLVRRIYTDRPPPRWPWERREERERNERHGEDEEPDLDS